MRFRGSLSNMGIIAAILLIFTVSFLSAQDCWAGNRTDEFEIIMKAWMDDQASFGVFMRPSSDLYNVLYNTATPSDDPLVLDIRTPSEYSKGHIKGAINIYWRDIAKKKSLAYLDSEGKKHAEAGKKNQIVVYHNTQHEQGWVATFLNMMGYDFENKVETLFWGLAAWTKDETVAPGRWKESSRKNYKTETNNHSLVPGKGWPKVDNATSTDPREIIRVAADRFFSNKSFNPRITAEELNNLLNDNNPNNDPYILSNRDRNDFPDNYNTGHIPGAYAIPVGKEGVTINGSDFLPTDRLIVVHCWVGVSQQYMVPGLNMLGYKVRTLDWGISSWSSDNKVVVQSQMSGVYGKDYPVEK